ncbi:hypothetical protein CP8484711_0199 [Chlamydia psittaci 84-8471/1]|nr:hypothetical protein CP8484711_0199 [Chlamydia psittaci 84-8471/1]
MVSVSTMHGLIRKKKICQFWQYCKSLLENLEAIFLFISKLRFYKNFLSFSH